MKLYKRMIRPMCKFCDPHGGSICCPIKDYGWFPEECEDALKNEISKEWDELVFEEKFVESTVEDILDEFGEISKVYEELYRKFKEL